MSSVPNAFFVAEKSRSTSAFLATLACTAIALPPRFVRLAGRTIAVRLDPFWMLNAQSVVNLLLKLTVRTDFVRSSWRHVHSHPQSYRRLSHRRDFVRRIF